MTTILSPLIHGPAVDTGRHVWRKQLLKVGPINHNGKRLDFSPDYLKQAAAAFNEAAFDQVPFQLAPADNTHTNDPERFRGAVKGLEFTGDGLDLLLEPTDAGEKVLKENPNLGVSARLVHDYARSDGKKFPVAVAHVLGTLDPVVTGLRPWEQVADLSNTDPNVIDLSTEEYTVAEPTTQTAPPAAPPAATPPALPVDDAAADALIASLSDQDLAAIQAMLESDDDADEPEGDDPPAEPAPAPQAQPQPVGAGASLSNTQLASSAPPIDLAARQRIDALETQLANERADREADAYLAAGVPPAWVNLARPALALPGQTIDLSNGQSTDSGSIIRGLLDFAKGTVDLSAEKGHSSSEVPDETKELMEAWDKDFK